MSNNNSSRMEVPQAKEAMDRFKMEVASELGVPLKNGGYNGDLTSAQNGSVGSSDDQTSGRGNVFKIKSCLTVILKQRQHKIF